MSAALRFDGLVALVTGAGGGRAGMGRAFALELARRGARVVVNDLGAGTAPGRPPSSQPADSVVEEIRAEGGVAIANADSVAEPEGGERMVQAALDEWGRLDVVVSNASVLSNRPFDELTVDEFDAVLAVHLRGAFCVLQPACRAMKHSGRGGQMVVLSSTAGLLGSPNQSNYAAAKMGQVGLLRSISIEGHEHGIRINGVGPGAFTQATLADLAASPLSGPMAEFAPETLSRMTVDQVTPLVTALAHPSCPYSGEFFCGWAGYYSRAWVAMSPGWIAPTRHTSAEDVVAHWDQIRLGAGHEPAENGISIGPAAIARAEHAHRTSR